MGNTGSCYDQAITSCNTSAQTPMALLRSLYYMSDHLPVVLTLRSTTVLGLPQDNGERLGLLVLPLGDGKVRVQLPPEAGPGTLSVYDMAGRQLAVHTGAVGAVDLPLPGSGVRIIRFSGQRYEAVGRVVCGPW